MTIRAGLLWSCCVALVPSVVNAQAGFEHVFDAAEGSQLVGVTPAVDGSLYVTLSAGGLHQLGTLARLMPDGQLFVLHDFDGTQGTQLNAAVSFGRDGKAYGTTSAGGKHGYGTLFYLGDCNRLQTLHDFSFADGGSPRGTLLPAADGGFYVVTYGVYREPSTPGNVLYVAGDGSARVVHAGLTQPTSGVIQGSDGYLYGAQPLILQAGGYQAQVYGAVYRVKPDGSDYQTDPAPYDAWWDPESELVEGPGGDIFGVSAATRVHRSPHVFRLTRNWDPIYAAWEEVALEGSVEGGVAFGSDGNLYAAGYDNYYRLTSSRVLTSIHEFSAATPPPTATMKPAAGGGFVVPSGEHLLRLAQAGGVDVLHLFGYRDGNQLSNLWQADNGEVYGSTAAGGGEGAGTVFRFAADGKLETLAALPATLLSALTFDPSSRMVYGLKNDNSLFSVSATGVRTTLHVFDPAAAPYPYFRVEPVAPVIGLDGALYGVTSSNDSSAAQGEVFRYQSASGELETFARFDGRSPTALLRAHDGTLWVITTTSLANPRRALERIATDGTVSVVRDLGLASSGWSRGGRLVEAADGGIYGSYENVLFHWSASAEFSSQSLAGANPSFAAGLSIAPDGTVFVVPSASWLLGTTQTLIVRPTGESVSLTAPIITVLLGNDGQAYRAAPLARDGYAGFRIEPIVLD